MNKAELLARRYGAIAKAYDDIWAPPLIEFSKPLLRDLDLASDADVVDLGAGTGALAAQFGALCVDRTEGMLAVAVSKGLPAVVADIRKIPLRDNAFDAAVSTFALQHVPTAGVVAREAFRILRAGGAYATATWSTDHGESGGAYDLLDQVFEDVPGEDTAMKTWHDRVDSPAKVQRLARAAGFGTVVAWLEPVTYEWTARTFTSWATTMGRYGRRLSSLPDDQREQVRHRLHEALSSCSREDFTWRPTVVYCIARR